MPRSAFKYEISGRTGVDSAGASALTTFDWAIDRLLRGRVLEAVASQTLDELDQRGRLGGRELAAVAGHHGQRRRAGGRVLGREALHDLDLRFHHGFGQVALVRHNGVAVLELRLA